MRRRFGKRETTKVVAKKQTKFQLLKLKANTHVISDATKKLNNLLFEDFVTGVGYCNVLKKCIEIVLSSLRVESAKHTFQSNLKNVDFCELQPARNNHQPTHQQ